MTDTLKSLWGDDFDIPVKDEKKEAKKIKEKINAQKDSDIPIEKQVKSKKISLEDRLNIIKDNVLRILGKQANNIVCIKDTGVFHDYITKALERGVIAIDTETNNTTDTYSCKLMGLCLYVPGEKQAYIPVNHRNRETKEKLPGQLTEGLIGKELQRIVDNSVKIIMHNADFDYQVIFRNCHIALPVYWDTMIAAQVLDENEKASLKEQYITKIDPEQDKYDINSLFDGLPYADIDPELFTFYAATDSLMTYKLYEWQVNTFKDPDNAKLYNLFRDVEQAVMPVVAKMELRGLSIDEGFNKRLSYKYNKALTDCDNRINAELDALRSTIDSWKVSPEANQKAKSYAPKKTKMHDDELAKRYPLVDSKGLRYKTGKTLAEQLGDPINLASPTQLGILLYDILKCPVMDKKSPRATGSKVLETLADKTKLSICKLLVERRGLVKLISTYVDNIPQLLDFWGDGKIRTHFKQYGAKTGRFSSGGKVRYMNEEGKDCEINSINAQNIPAKIKFLRMMFKADENVESYRPLDTDDKIKLFKNIEVETVDGWKLCTALNIGDKVLLDDGTKIIKEINKIDENYLQFAFSS